VSVAGAFDLVFHAPLRVGGSARDNADAARDFPSDTLSAALVVAAADLFGDTVHDRSIADVARDPPWVVSSLLPWAELGGAPVRFFPRPADHAFPRDGTAKTYRRVAYLSADLLAQPSLAPHLSECHTLAAGSKEIGALTWQRRAVRPSVTLDRVTSASDLFHLEEVAVATVPRGEHATAKAGAWLAVRTEDEAGMKLVRTLLRHLADSGIGADRARGMGCFSILRDEPLQLAELAQRRVLLGYASPDDALAKALRDDEARYTVVRRGGRAHGAQGGLGLQRRSLRLVAPGALLPDAGAVVGRTRDVTPPGFVDHRIFRDGRTLAWPLGAT
jgi:CRISPR type III-A-associated RAMP protein Csm4